MMLFNELTPGGEQLLKEILDNRLENGDCNMEYWNKRFDRIGFAKDSHLRSIFKELSDAEMIAACWASGRPYEITVLNNGLSYFDIKQEAKKQDKKEKGFQLLQKILNAIPGILFKLLGIGG